MATGTIKDEPSFRWLGDINGANSISIPSDAKELLIYADYSNNIITLYLQTSFLGTTSKRFRAGAYINSTTKYGVTINATSTNLSVGSYYSNDTDVSASCVTNVYYK